jgi:phage terminase large subunit
LVENGGWALFITTQRGKNHAHRMLEIARTEPHWFWQISTVDDSGIIPNERLLVEEREIVKQYGEIQGTAYFQQEFFCSFESPILGAVYADALQSPGSGGSYLSAEGRAGRSRAYLVLGVMNRHGV